MRDTEVRWTEAELAEFSRNLEEYHRVFGVFWTMSSISYTESASYCATAMVFLKGRPRIVINKQWWEKLTHRDHVFVIVHECLHAMLDHGLRNGKDEVPHATPLQVNQAQDITINEMAEALFGIPRTDLTDWQKYCWISTCFPGDATVLPNESFVYYLEKLAKDNVPRPQLVLDMHGDGDEDSEPEDSGLDELYEALTPEELEALVKASGRRGPGVGLSGFLKRQEVKHKLSIKKLIKGMRTAASRMKPNDTFVTAGRRFASLPDNMLLPDAHNSKRGHDRFHVALCLDVSGSVVHLRPLFYEMRELFLKEKEHLEIKSYVFADLIVEITSAEQQYDVGGGNAPFQLIERELTKPIGKTKKIPRYPDCVIVITDGKAGGVNPKHPKRWLWLLTEHNDTSVIPPESKYYKISDVLID